MCDVQFLCMFTLYVCVGSFIGGRTKNSTCLLFVVFCPREEVKMQCTNYLPGFFYPRDHVVSLTGNSQSIPHGDIAYNSSRGFNLAFPPFMVDQSQEFVYQKEILRQTILKHEATFRYQVYTWAFLWLAFETDYFHLDAIFNRVFNLFSL